MTRIPRFRALAAAAVAVAALAALAGCAPEPVDPVELPPGSCVAEAWNNGPDRSAVVDCSAPHLFEAVASIGEWEFRPEEFGVEESRPGEIYERLVLAEPGDELAEAYRSWAEPACELALLELLGLDRVTVGDLAGPQLGLRVDAPYALIASLSTRAQFELGDRTTLCAVAWLDDAGALSPVELPPGATIAALAGPGLPVGLRECFLFEDGAHAPADCAAPHAGQVVVDLNARAALGDEWVTGVDPATGRSDDYRAADAVCAEILGQLLPEGALGGGREAWADIRPTGGWVGFDGSVVEGAVYPVSCAVAVAGRASLLEGDVWGELPPTPAPSGAATPAP